MSMVLIDLSNFFNGFISESPIDPRLTKTYFIDWLDLGLLASTISPRSESFLGTWIFYSKRALGRAPARLTAEELAEFVKRQNRIPGTSAIDVGIPGEQGESFTFKCSSCGFDNSANSQSEKGIDSSLITHLFDTMEHWKIATIISQDADYVPAVRALRKRGKFVYGAGFIKRAAEGLITECFEYKDVGHEFIQRDLSLFLIFQNDGLLSRLLKTANKMEEVIAKSSFREKSDMFDEGGWFTIVVMLQPEIKEIASNNEQLLLEQARAIKKEFPTFFFHEKRGPKELIRMGVFLDPIQHRSLIRANENYLVIKVFR